MNLFAAHFLFPCDKIPEVQEAVEEWLIERGFPRLPAEASGFEKVCSAGHLTVERALNAQGLRAFAATVTRPDQIVEDRKFRLSCGAIVETDQVRFTVLREVLDLSVRAGGGDRPRPTLPTMLDTVLRRVTPLPRSVGYSIIDIDEPTLPMLRDDIFDPSRQTPLLIVSPEAFREKPLLDVEEAQKNLEGVAQLYVLSKRAAKAVGSTLGERFVVWDGACLEVAPLSRALIGRIFRPAFIRQFHGDEFQQYLFHGIVAHATPRLAAAHIGLEAVIRLRQTAAVQEATARARQSEGQAEIALSLATEEVTRSQQTISRLEGKVLELEERNEDLVEREAELRATIEALQSQLRAKRASAAIEQIREPLTIAEIASWLEAAYPNSVVVTNNAERSLADCPFADTPRCVALFRVLVGPLREHLAGRVAVQCVLDALTPIAGAFSPRSSEKTMGMFGDYFFTYEGRRVDGGAHLGIGTSRDPKRTFRIHFYYDKPKDMIVVLHAGRHLSTTQS